MKTMNNTKQSIAIYLLLGIILGIITHFLTRLEYRSIFVYSSTFLFFLFYGFCYNEKQSLRLILTSFSLAFFISLPFLNSNYGISSSFPSEESTVFVMLFPLLAYVTHCFHYAFHRDNTWHITYQSLFFAVWDTFVLLGVTVIFFAIVKGLIYLALLMFGAFGYQGVWDWYSHYLYMFINPILFFLGLSIASQYYNMIHNLRFILLSMMRFLLPLLLLITICYLILFWVTSTEKLGFLPTQSLLMIIFAILGIIFFNAFFQTGKEIKDLSKPFSLIIQFYRLTLFGMCFTLTYFIIKHNSLPFNSIFILIISLLYGVAYAGTAFFPAEKQIQWVRRANIAIALFFLTGVLVLNNPILPIYRPSLSSPVSFDLFKPRPSTVAVPPIGNLIVNTSLLNINKQQAIIDKNLNKLGFFWSISEQDNAYIAGYRDGKPVYICRTFYDEGYQIGSLFDKVCTITYAGHAFPVASFQVFVSHNTTPLLWASYPNQLNTLVLAIEPTPVNLRSLHVCRVQFERKFYVGKTVEGVCNIAKDSQELSLPIQAVLTTPTKEHRELAEFQEGGSVSQ